MMYFITDPSRWMQGFVPGLTTGAFLVIMIQQLITLFWSLVERRKRNRRRREIETGERCIGGIRGCKGGMTCTSSHK